VASPGYLKKHGHPTDPQQLVADRHRMIDFRDPETGRPFLWEFRKGRKEIKVETQSQLMLSDVATMHAVCLAGYGIAQLLELGVDAHLASGRMVALFPDWEEERFPLYAYYPSRQYLAPKTRAFLEFLSTTVQASRSRKPIPADSEPSQPMNCSVGGRISSSKTLNR